MRIKGKVWRHIPAGASPLHLGFVLKARGRWNREGIYGCLYTSFSKRGAIAEYRKYLRAAGIPYRGVTKPRELVSLQVEIDPVMDLTDPNVSPIPTSSPFLTGDLPQELDDCRAMADYLRAQGFSGIITPSAALSKQKNLIIYYDGIASNLDIDFGGDRIPL